VRKLSATYIFPGNRPPLKNGILVCDDDGSILDVTDTGGIVMEQPGMEYYSGILVPGLINTYGRWEHSHLKGKTPEEPGLDKFPGHNDELINCWQGDIRKFKNRPDSAPVFFVLCPNARGNIESHLQQVLLYQRKGIIICLGTDNPDPNHERSVLKEMITIHQYSPSIAMQDLIEWACINGARALGLEKKLGSFDRGKTPGINLITGMDLKNLKLTSISRVKKMIH